jgi:hypothetical protein
MHVADFKRSRNTAFSLPQHSRPSLRLTALPSVGFASEAGAGGIHLPLGQLCQLLAVGLLVNLRTSRRTSSHALLGRQHHRNMATIFVGRKSEILGAVAVDGRLLQWRTAWNSIKRSKVYLGFLYAPAMLATGRSPFMKTTRLFCVWRDAIPDPVMGTTLERAVIIAFSPT